jgi:hypothetical protein
MLYSLSRSLKKYAKGQLIAILFLIDLVFTVFIMPFIDGFIERASTNQVPIDLMFFYTPLTVWTKIAGYGDYQRLFYRTADLTVDLVYPLIYTLFFSLLITWLFKKGFAPNSDMQLLNVVPFGALLFDLLENFCIDIMLSIYPATPVNLGWIATFFTMTKWIFVGASLILVVIGITAAIAIRIPKGKLENPPSNNPKENLSIRPVAKISFATEITQKRKG